MTCLEWTGVVKDRVSETSRAESTKTVSSREPGTPERPPADPRGCGLHTGDQGRRKVYMLSCNQHACTSLYKSSEGHKNHRSLLAFSLSSSAKKAALEWRKDGKELGADRHGGDSKGKANWK